MLWVEAHDCKPEVSDCSGRLHGSKSRQTKPNGNFSFISLPGFDHRRRASDPAITRSRQIGHGFDRKLHAALADPYHSYSHKWLVPSPRTYVIIDFDVARECQRSRSRLRMSRKRASTKSLIGRRSYWNEHVVPRLS